MFVIKANTKQKTKWVQIPRNTQLGIFQYYIHGIVRTQIISIRIADFVYYCRIWIYSNMITIWCKTWTKFFVLLMNFQNPLCRFDEL